MGNDDLAEGTVKWRKHYYMFAAFDGTVLIYSIHLDCIYSSCSTDTDKNFQSIDVSIINVLRKGFRFLRYVVPTAAKLLVSNNDTNRVLVIS